MHRGSSALDRSRTFAVLAHAMLAPPTVLIVVSDIPVATTPMANLRSRMATPFRLIAGPIIECRGIAAYLKSSEITQNRDDRNAGPCVPLGRSRQSEVEGRRLGRVAGAALVRTHGFY
jgi:hypothetical protein